VTIPEPRPLEGDERTAVCDDANLQPCRECRRVRPHYVAVCSLCLVPLCTPCWHSHHGIKEDGRFTCTGRSFQDTQEGE